jgi:hypothetical protein
MSGELSGMVYDGPMTENQSVIEKIAMINFGEKRLKFLLDRPLISAPRALAGPRGNPNKATTKNHCFIRDPSITLFEYR